MKTSSRAVVPRYRYAELPRRILKRDRPSVAVVIGSDPHHSEAEGTDEKIGGKIQKKVGDIKKVFEK